MSAEPKQQHFVAQAYLKPWSHKRSTGKHFCYVSRKKNPEWRVSNIKSIMKEGDIYTIFGLQGEKDRYWERWFGDLEARYAVVRDKIGAGERVLSPTDHDTLAFFVSAQLHRTPAVRKRLVQGLHQIRQLYERSDGASVPFMCAPGSRTYQPHELSEAIKRPMTYVLLPEIKELFAKIKGMRIVLVEAVSKFGFLTSDNPAFICYNYPPQPAVHIWGVTHVGTKIFMPISPTICAVLTWMETPERSNRLDPNILIHFNASIYGHAQEWIISLHPFGVSSGYM